MVGGAEAGLVLGGDIPCREIHVKLLDGEERRNVTDWTAACILGPSKMTVCTRVGGPGAGPGGEEWAGGGCT